MPHEVPYIANRISRAPIYPSTNPLRLHPATLQTEPGTSSYDTPRYAIIVLVLSGAYIVHVYVEVFKTESNYDSMYLFVTRDN